MPSLLGSCIYFVRMGRREAEKLNLKAGSKIAALPRSMLLLSAWTENVMFLAKSTNQQIEAGRVCVLGELSQPSCCPIPLWLWRENGRGSAYRWLRKLPHPLD